MADNNHRTINITLEVWRQPDSQSPGRFVEYKVSDVSPEMSFLEMLDVLNDELIESGDEPIAFDHDCREGICGSCGMMINGQAHGPLSGTTTCQLHMRTFKNGDHLRLEPWRATAFPVVRDLVVDRTALDRIIQSGGYVSVSTGNAPDANAILVKPKDQNTAMDAAACIGCGACVASCKNASAMLFTAAKVSHLSKLPQGDPERKSRVRDMVAQMDEEGFGGCTNTYECEAACPAEISVSHIARLNREYAKALIRE